MDDFNVFPGHHFKINMGKNAPLLVIVNGDGEATRLLFLNLHAFKILLYFNFTIHFNFNIFVLLFVSHNEEKTLRRILFDNISQKNPIS
jgi:hypothetical protein